METALRLRRASAALFAGRASRMRFDAMHAVTGPYAHGDPRRGAGRAAGTVVNGDAAARFRRPSSRTPTRSTPTTCYELMMGAGRARFRRGLGRRRRPQPDHRPRPSSSRRRTRWRCWPPTPISRRATPRGSTGIARSMPTSARRRPRRRRSSAFHATRRRPAGSSSATCSMPDSPRSAARRAPAPAPTMSARRTGSGPCCCG